MPIYRVKCYKAGEWDKKDDIEIEADNELEAAEKVCGEPLLEGSSKPGLYRVEVWKAGNPLSGKSRTIFLPNRF